MVRSRLALSILVGLIAGLGGETLLFLQRQCRLVEESMREDFRVLLFLKDDLDEGRQKVLEERLRALPDVNDVRAVSRQEQLAALKREDPELIESVALLGDNPLTPAFEVSLGEAGVSRVAHWLSQAQPLADWADARYKPAQVQAILQAQFYARLLDLALSGLVCLGVALMLAGVWSFGRAGLQTARRATLESLGGAAAGAAVSAGAICLLVLPMRAVSPWWGWPSAMWQAILIGGAAVAGWVLCARHE